MQRDSYEIRTQRNIKIGNISVCGEHLVMSVKRGKNEDDITLEEIIRQMLGEGVPFVLIVGRDYIQRITEVRNMRRILRLKK